MLEFFTCTLMLPATLLCFSKYLTDTLMRKYFPVVANFYQAALKSRQSFGGNFKPRSSASFNMHHF